MQASTSTIPTVAEVLSMGTLEKFVGVGGVEVTVVARRNIQPDGSAREVLATDDGRVVDHANWHDGLPGEREVYFEVWRLHDGTHGFADSGSRRVVQVG